MRAKSSTKNLFNDPNIEGESRRVSENFSILDNSHMRILSATELEMLNSIYAEKSGLLMRNSIRKSPSMIIHEDV